MTTHALSASRHALDALHRQWVTMASVLCVCLGIVLATLSQAAFSLPGFLLVAAACVFSALRWVSSQ